MNLDFVSWCVGFFTCVILLGAMLLVWCSNRGDRREERRNREKFLRHGGVCPLCGTLRLADGESSAGAVLPFGLISCESSVGLESSSSQAEAEAEAEADAKAAESAEKTKKASVKEMHEATEVKGGQNSPPTMPRPDGDPKGQNPATKE